MNPYDTIARVLRILPDTIQAYDEDDLLVAELTEEGLLELRQRRPDLLVESRLLSSTFEVRVRTTGPGGISSPARAIKMLKAGCSAVQVYTPLVYEGPGLVHRINREVYRTQD